MEDGLKPFKYQLVIRIPFEAIDNLQARQISKGFLDASPNPEGTVVKLQRLEERKEPVGVPL